MRVRAVLNKNTNTHPQLPIQLQDREEDANAVMFNVRPFAIGFVRRGANNRPFFWLRKSSKQTNQKGDVSMPDQTMITSGLEAQDETTLGDATDDVTIEELDDEEEIGANTQDSSTASRLLDQLLTLLTKRRQRDPVGAAQRALGQIGGHPELTEIAQKLVEFIQSHSEGRPKAPKPHRQQSYPEPNGEESEKGALSVANAATLSPQPSTDAMANSQGLAEQLAQLAKELSALKAQLAERELQDRAQAIANSTGLSPETVIKLQKSGIEGVQQIFDEVARWRRIAKSSGLCTEIGSSAAPEEDETLATLRKHATDLQANKGLPFDLAVIEASRMLRESLDLE